MYPADIRHNDEGRSLGGPRWEHTCQPSESGWLRQTRIDPLQRDGFEGRGAFGLISLYSLRFCTCY